MLGVIVIMIIFAGSQWFQHRGSRGV